MDLSEKSRLEKLLGMLGSSFDGERANAARMIAAMAEKQRLTIVELIYGPGANKRQASSAHSEPRSPRPRQNSKTILDVLEEIANNSEAYEFTITDWEYQFASDVSGRYSFDYELSEKQILTAEKIIRKAELARQQQSAP